MEAYRIYFYNGKDRICGREDFEDEGDAGALAIAETVFDACSDVAARFELWCGGRPVAPEKPAPTTLIDVLEKRQQAIVRLEETIRDSNWAIASSRRLIEKLNMRRARLGR